MYEKGFQKEKRLIAWEIKVNEKLIFNI
jgi:hypothetical protein